MVCVTKGRCMSPSGTPATQNEGGCHMMSPSTMPATRNEGGCHQVPHLPRETKVNVTKCHACHAKCRGVTGAQAGPSAPPSAICPTPATQNESGCEFVPRLPRETKVDVRLCHACHAKCRGVTGAQAGPSAPPSAICRTPATQNDGGCDFVPRLPREMKVDVRLCHACHAKCRGVTGAQAGPSAPPSAICPTPATQNDGGCEFVPRLPRETKVDVRLCHACHAKCRGVTGAQAGPSAPPSAICPTPATQNDGGCDFVPRLPREMKVDVRLCHACHAKCRGVTGAQAGPSAPPSAICRTPATQNDGGCEFVPRLPRETKVDVRLCHACHAKCRGVTGAQAGPSAPPSAICRTPATQNDGGCDFVPRLPREMKVDVRLCHACHAKCRGVTGAQAGPSAPPSAICRTPATQNDGGCDFVPRLPREMKVDVRLCHACHAKCRGVTGAQAGPSAPPSAICRTPATQNDGGCDFVPRLPREMKVDVRLCHACHAKCRGVTGAQAGPSAPPSAICPTPATQNDGGCDFVPRLPREMKVDVRLCHACHAKCRGVTGAQAGPSAPPSAICRTPATQNDGGCDFVPRLPREMKVDVRLCHACHAKCRGVTGAQAGPSAPPSAICRTPATQNDGGCDFVPRLPRETKVDVRLCHACHAKCRGVTGAQAGPSAPPSAICPTPATQNDGGCDFVPRLPRETKVDVRLCHACHAKWVYVDKVFVDKVCVDKVCGDKVCVDKVCVWTKCVVTKYVLTKCVVTKYVLTKCVVTKCVWTKCVVTKCVWTKSVWTKCVRGQSVCVGKVCGDKVCVDKVCGDKVCVDKVCVGMCWQSVWWQNVCWQSVCW